MIEGGSEWFRALDLEPEGPWFKSSTLLLSGFVLNSPEFNPSTAGFLIVRSISKYVFIYLFYSDPTQFFSASFFRFLLFYVRLYKCKHFAKSHVNQHYRYEALGLVFFFISLHEITSQNQ